MSYGLRDDADLSYYSGASDILDELACLAERRPLTMHDIGHCRGMVARRVERVLEGMARACEEEEHED